MRLGKILSHEQLTLLRLLADSSKLFKSGLSEKQGKTTRQAYLQWPLPCNPNFEKIVEGKEDACFNQNFSHEEEIWLNRRQIMSSEQSLTNRVPSQSGNWLKQLV